MKSTSIMSEVANEALAEQFDIPESTDLKASIEVQEKSELEAEEQPPLEIPYEVIKDCVLEVIQNDLSSKELEKISNKIILSVRERLFSKIGKFKIIHNQILIKDFKVEMLSNKFNNYKLVLNSRELGLKNDYNTDYLLFEKVEYEDSE